MTILDYMIFTAYLIGILAFGLYMYKRNNSSSDYFLADRSMGWLTIGLSVMVTAFSSINYMALPSEVFKHGLYVTIALPIFFLVGVPITRWFMPFYHKLQVTTAYEFLEDRFDRRVRLLASGMFIVWRLTWVAVALYASGRLLQVTTGLSLPLVIIFSGAVATLYTVFGGIRAVMWTDVIQFVILLGSIIAALFTAQSVVGDGFISMISRSADHGLLKPFYPFDPQFFSLDPTIRITFWSGLIGVTVAFIARYGADQVVVQRYFTAKSLKDAQRGYWLNSCAAFIALLLLALFGIAIYAYADNSHPQLIDKLPPLKHMGLLIQQLPAGITGLIIAGLMSATMSSVDSGINACNAAWETDFSRRTTVNSPNQRMMLTASLGFIVTGAALMFISILGSNKSLFVMINKLINGLGSPLLTLVICGMFPRFFTKNGVFYGGIVGISASIVISLFVPGYALHYYAVLNLFVTIVPCFVFSLTDFNKSVTHA